MPKFKSVFLLNFHLILSLYDSKCWKWMLAWYHQHYSSFAVIVHIFATPLRSEFYEWKIPMFFQVKIVFFLISHCDCFGLYYATNFVHLTQCDFVTSRTRMKMWHISAGFCIIASHLGRVWVKLPNQRFCLIKSS